MNPIEDYSKSIRTLVSEIEQEEMEKIQEAADLMADKIKEDRLINVFGPGHGAMAAEELFFRAGGLVPVNPIFDSALSLRNVLKCVEAEHVEGYTDHNLDYYNVDEGDVLIVVNYVAVEPASISLAIAAQKKGVEVIGLTSSEFCDEIPADAEVRHSSNKDLSDVSDIFIDTHVPAGDAAVKIEDLEQKVSPVSTVAHTFIVNSLVAQIVKNLVDDGVEPPVLMSTSMPDAEENNQRFFDKYGSRIKHF